MNERRSAQLSDGRGSSIFPCGRTRREFVWEMGGGFAGTALAGMLAAQGIFLAKLLGGDTATQVVDEWGI